MENSAKSLLIILYPKNAGMQRCSHSTCSKLVTNWEVYIYERQV